MLWVCEYVSMCERMNICIYYAIPIRYNYQNIYVIDWTSCLLFQPIS